tara:strand:+ start:203 stop:433 length:231 start_codon:yes stop_codon:yes gene_type:complete
MNEAQHVKYIDELLWLLEDARRVANREADFEVLKMVIDEMSDGIPEWLEKQKRKPPHIEVWSEGELLIGSGMWREA